MRIRCWFCGHDQSVDDGVLRLPCESCGTPMDIEKAKAIEPRAVVADPLEDM